MNSSELVLLSFLILLQKGRILMKYCMDHIPDIDRPSSIKLISYTIHILVFLCLLYLTFCQYFCIDMILKIAEIIGNDMIVDVNWPKCGGAAWCCPDHSFAPIQSHQSITIWFVHSPHCPLELQTNLSEVSQCPGKAPTWPSVKHSK